MKKVLVAALSAVLATAGIAGTYDPYITDEAYQFFHLDRPADDDDDDGLSNYSEYLISNVWKICSCNPNMAKTDGVTLDYWRKFDSCYLGEVFTDHDQIDDRWEAQYAKIFDGKPAANASIYDPEEDIDKDGWSNYEEFRAGTDPTDDASHPVPEVKITLWNFTKTKGAQTVVVQAWNDKEDGDMVGYPCASWTVTNVVLGTQTEIVLNEPNNSFMKNGLRSGASRFVVFADKDGNGMYTAGEPFGYVSNVDVGWQGARFTVNLTDISVIFARLSLVDGTNDRAGYAEWNSGWADWSGTIRTNNGGVASIPDGSVRVRVVRTAVNGLNIGAMKNSKKPYEVLDAQAVVLDKVFNRNIRSYLHEGDFLDSSMPDIDWYTLAYDAETYRAAGWNWPVNMTCVTYRVVFGDGDITASITNPPSLKYMVDRRFDTDYNTIKTLITPYAAVTTYNTRPTFRWAITSGGVNYNSYSTFVLQVFEQDGTTLVYDSGEQRMPGYETRNGINYYVWTAPSIVDNLSRAGGLVARNGSYKWKVTVYNAKFRAGKSSELGTLTTSVNVTQDVNDHAYSAIPVCVKYTGSTNVLAKVADLNERMGKVRVQAFASADFSGAPLSEAIVTNDLADASRTVANGKLYGLPKDGAYYLRAYIDSNGDGQKDNWESWGAATAIVAAGTATPAGIYIEDADTDDDWLPDAWEFAQNNWRGSDGWLSKKGKDVSGVVYETDPMWAAVQANLLPNNISQTASGATFHSLTYTTFSRELNHLTKSNTLQRVRSAR